MADFDVVVYALLKTYINNALVDNGNVTPEERAKIERIIIDGTGDMFLSNDGTYKFVTSGTTNYEDLNGKPSINSIELDGNKTASQLGFSSVATTGSYNDLTDVPVEKNMLSQFINDTGFITNSVGNLINYYLKSDTYNKTEVNTLIGNLGSLNVEIVETLPTSGISTSTIYLIKIGTTTNYNQWMYIDNSWANIGSTVIDLSNYYTKTETNTLLNNKVDKVTGYGLSQENFSPEEKTKLSELTNYILPEATTAVLGGVKIDGTTIAKDSNGVISATGGSGENVIDDEVTSLTKTWSSEKINNNIETVGQIVNDINIAQKTVNQRGITELLSNPELITINTTPTVGTPVTTTVNKTITLKESITNYDKINIQIIVNGSERKYNFPINSINTKSIIYNNTNNALNDGSTILLEVNLPTGNPNSFGSADIGFRIWFKTPTQLYIYEAVNPFGDLYNRISISSIEGVKLNPIVIDPVEYINTTQGIEDSPVGNVISFMGITPPQHYLSCDGSIYNAIDYPFLAQFIHDQFGSYNYFGGDGTTTFAVPDLRGEFLRGTGTANRNTGTGLNVGIHQDATEHMRVASDGTSNYLQIIAGSGYQSTTKEDHGIGVATKYFNIPPVNQGAVSGDLKYTSRPTNTSVLYCIKYEPTFFMKIEGLIEETTLWEGNIGTNTVTSVSNSISLSDSYKNYDKLGFYYIGYGSNDTNTQHPQYREIPPYIINNIRNAVVPATITLDWGYAGNPDYTTILKTSTDNQLNIIQSYSRLIKLVGIKYKTFQT